MFALRHRITDTVIFTTRIMTKIKKLYNLKVNTNINYLAYSVFRTNDFLELPQILTKIMVISRNVY